MSKRALCLAVLVALFGYCQYTYGKGSPDKIIIKSTGLSHDIEIADRATLKNFDPWSGQFIDWAGGIVTKPPTGDAIYEVSFYIKWRPKDRHLRFFYVFRYVPGRDGERGYIYLPANSDAWNRVNLGTIIREGHDGHWHYASKQWDRLMEQLVLQRPSQTGCD